MAGTRLILVLLLASSVCHIHANDGGASSASAPATLGIFFERAPESAVAPKGDEVVFECELNLKPDRLEWRFRRSGSPEPYRYLRSSAGYNVTSGSDDRAWRLRIYVSAQTAGDYQCVAWYGPGALASTPARLALVSIELDGGQGATGAMAPRGSIRWSVAPKNCLLIRCGSVISNPPAIWSFYRNGKKLPQSELLPGAAGALVLDTVTAKDAGNYSCVATNAITGDELRLPQTIELRVDYTDRTPPYFLQRPPTEYSARPGETVVLECPGVGSPRPGVIWSSPNVAGIYNNRSKILPYGLQITDLRPEDQGSYICMLDNGIAPPIDHTVKLSVLQRPTILKGPAATLTNESNSLLLVCSATGNPLPDIYWLINGEDATKDPEAQVDNRSLRLWHVQKRHAGVVQCFAKNILGETSEGNMLRVNPLQITGEDEEPLGGVPMWPVHEPNGGMGSSSTPSGGSKNKGGRRKYKASMVPPSRPNVTRLSDESVMLRWSVPQNSGLQITFFKVQYRRLGDGKNRRENWQTTSDNIPFGNSYGSGSGSAGSGNNHWRQRNRDREYEMGNPPKNFTSSVTGLTAGKYYRFRIVAVYSNNDNKEGNTSLKFFLQNGTAKSNLPVPELREVEAISESAVILHWSLVASDRHDEVIDGYYAYYRPVDSAAEYLKATVDGARSRSFKIDLLRPGTHYEFKLQSFNSDAASEFSAIRQARTKKTTDQAASSSSTPEPANKTADQRQNSIYPVIAGAAGGGILLLIASLVACMCLKRRENSQPEDENKPQLEHIQADFVTSAVLGVGGHHKSGDVRRLNGVIPRMNITPNPLAQETASDKNRNVMELRFLPPLANGNGNGNGNCIARDLATEQQPEAVEQQADAEDEGEDDQDQSLPAVASSSCETLEACDEAVKLNLNLHPKLDHEPQDPHNPVLEAPSKPLPPLPKKPASTAGQNNSGLHQNGLHHAQPYHPPGTPTLMHKRLDYHQQQQQQQPPPVPPHSAYYQQAPTHNHHQASPMMSPREDGAGTPTPTRIPSLRRQRRTSGGQVHNSHSNLNLNLNLSHHHNNNNNNNLPPHHQHLHHHPGHPNHPVHPGHPGGHPNGLVGIPIVPGSPRVQRSPMPSRAMIKRTRLGSHTDNISSGSLNSIEV
ncbi:interference hedgehog isoform X1 [Drosophila elegans]|uniref:interference hedgehog isoform X1 n=1 Tax=Drosophila elegans TaxID=30023 RepID=UPI0007E7DFB8|nr:interference hedgehog isoform X1 [Drosophila elegans]XP_041564898.1 interference hedgehog isoform X1 [Drosophila elegans]